MQKRNQLEELDIEESSESEIVVFVVAMTTIDKPVQINHCM